jgi:hypothetical protein
MPEIVFKDPSFQRTPCDLLLHAFVKKYVVPLSKSNPTADSELGNWGLCWEDFSATNRLDRTFDHMIEILLPFKKQIFDDMYKTFTKYRQQIFFPSWSMKVIDWIVRVSHYRILTSDENEWQEQVLNPFFLKNTNFFDCADMFLQKQRQSSFDSFNYIDRIIDNINNITAFALRKSILKTEMEKVMWLLKSFVSSHKYIQCQIWIVRFMIDTICQTDDATLIKDLYIFLEHCQEQFSYWNQNKYPNKNIIEYFSEWSYEVQPYAMKFILCDFETPNKKPLYESVFVLDYMVQTSELLTKPFKEEWEKEVLKQWFKNTEEAARFFDRAEIFFNKYLLITDVKPPIPHLSPMNAEGSKTQGCKANKYFVVLDSYN